MANPICAFKFLHLKARLEVAECSFGRFVDATVRQEFVAFARVIHGDIGLV